MKVRKMRWGYSGTGMACGPVEGDTVVEIMVTDEQGRDYFVLESRWMEFAKMIVSPVSQFDLQLNWRDSELSAEEVNEKEAADAEESYDFEVDDGPEEMDGSRFGKVMRLVRLAMETGYQLDEPDEASAEQFIAEYVDRDLEELPIPAVHA